MNPETEVVGDIYTPLPDEGRHEADRRRRPPVAMRDRDGRPVVFPKTAEEWAEPRWVDYACNADAPWLDDRLRQRIHDFVTVLRCRYPTVQDRSEESRVGKECVSKCRSRWSSNTLKNIKIKDMIAIIT